MGKSSHKVPQINKTQLTELHYLLAFGAYVSIMEGSTTTKSRMKDIIYDKFHGTDDDDIGTCENFLKGEGRYNVFWDNAGERNAVITAGFGCLTGLSIMTIETQLRYGTVSGNKLLEGRTLLDRAKIGLQKAKKLLGYWNEFEHSGEVFPSGMKEMDALQHVINRYNADHWSNVDDEDDNIDASTVDFYETDENDTLGSYDTDYIEAWDGGEKNVEYWEDQEEDQREDQREDKEEDQEEKESPQG